MPFCQDCGNQVPEEASFCRQCGSPQAKPPSSTTTPPDPQVSPPAHPYQENAESPPPSGCPDSTLPPAEEVSAEEVSNEAPVRRGLLSTPLGEMTGGQRFTIGCLGLLIMVIPLAVLCGVLIEGSDSGTSYETTDPSRAPTLTEYWDRSACFDLFTRTEAADRAGISRADWIASLSRAEGAVKRYGGPTRVLAHCNNTYGSAWRSR